MMRIFIPKDAAALSVGAEKTAEAFAADLARRGLEAEIVRTGSRGMFWLEPLVEVATPEGRIGFGPVKAGDVAGVVDAIITGNGGHHLALGAIDKIPYLAKQERLPSPASA